MFRRQSLSVDQALQKLRHYCSYQERCHQEVREKLYSFGLRKPDVENAICTLIGEDQLNEERFAVQFAGGHFRMKQWGRIKIRHELRQRQLSDYCITKALACLGEDEYTKALSSLAAKKWATLSDEPDLFIRRRKLQDYLLQKGYEPELVTAAAKNLR